MAGDGQHRSPRAPSVPGHAAGTTAGVRRSVRGPSWSPVLPRQGNSDAVRSGVGTGCPVAAHDGLSSPSSRDTSPPSQLGRPLDLVLLHHRLAFPPSRWKQVRSRLGTGRPHTVVLPAQAWPARLTADHRRVRYREFRDHLRWDIAADTLVLTGSREAFELEADQVRALAEECPAHRARMPGTPVMPGVRQWPATARNSRQIRMAARLAARGRGARAGNADACAGGSTPTGTAATHRLTSLRALCRLGVVIELP